MHEPSDTLDIRPRRPEHSAPLMRGDERDPQAAAQARARLAALHSPEAAAETLQPTMPGVRVAHAESPHHPAGHHPVQRARKAANGIPSPIRPLIVSVGIFLILLGLFKLPIVISQLRYSANHSESQSALPAAGSTVPPQPLISIPKINVEAPVVFSASNTETAIQKDLQSGVVHYAGTAMPGQLGNSVLVGHSSNDWWEPGNYKFVFVLLDKLAVGDTFSINYNSQRYVYTVTSTEVVPPTAVGVLNPTSDAQMTLITCTPPGTSWKRLIIHAKLTGPGATAVTQSTSQAAGTSLPGESPSLANQIGSAWSRFLGEPAQR
jgi:LPXTG-site transpeptidase (sortase) family protein